MAVCRKRFTPILLISNQTTSMSGMSYIYLNTITLSTDPC